VIIEKTFRGKIPRTLIALSGQGRAAFDVYRKQLADIVSKITEE
jgi:hypothetical protein